MSAAQAEIARQSAELAREGVAVETRVVFGLTARLVLEAARTVETSLIVVGTHGRKSMARLFLGSSAEEVVRSAPCPVLVTGERGADFARWEGQAPLRLAVATDGSRATESLFRWARASVPAIAEQISLVRMYWPPQEASRYGIEAPWLGNEGHPDLLELIERDLRHD